MKKVIAYIGLGLVVLLAIIYGLYATFMSGPSESYYSEYLEPGIYDLEDQKVIKISMTGSPQFVSGKAIGLLFNTYYKIPQVSKGMPPAPRARWFSDPDESQDTWKSEFAMPIPESVTSVPFDASGTFEKIEIGTWEYGLTAILLHKGAYDAEEPTINRLKEFIVNEGYDIIDAHEEEYVKGPMPFLFRGPDKYLTLIKYRVKKVE